MAKRKKRETVADRPSGPKQPKSTALSAANEVIIVAFRRHILLPRDDCLHALQATIPQATERDLDVVALLVEFRIVRNRCTVRRGFRCQATLRRAGA